MTWPEAVQTMGKWYAANVHTYIADAKTHGSCPLLGGHGVRYDCTGYLSSCLQLFGVVPRGYGISSEMAGNPQSDFGKRVAKAGFKVLKYNKSILLPFDIVAVFEGRGKGQQHHAEIYAGKVNGKDKSWTWGNVHDNAHGGLPSSFANYRYKVIYRYDGVSRDAPNFVDLSGAGSEVSGDTGGGGGGTYIINLENYVEPYPVHSEYETYTGIGGNIYEKAENNAFSLATLSNNIDSSKDFFSHKNEQHTRIYSTNDAKIVLDELKLPLDYMDDTYANKDITQEDVKKWQSDMEKQKEEAKKKQEETVNSSIGTKDSSTQQTNNTSTSK